MTLHRLKLKDLDAQFIQRLKAAYNSEEIEVTFWLDTAVPSVASADLSEDEFWSLIDLLDWKKEKNDEIIAPVVKQLSERSVAAIQTFADILSQKLYQLDGKKYAQHIGENSYQVGEYFSVDRFLYARCCVVANGKEFYEEVLQQPTQMPKDLTFGALLRIAAIAYEMKTGESFKYFPKYIHETYANASAWNGKRFINKILAA